MRHSKALRSRQASYRDVVLERLGAPTEHYLRLRSVAPATLKSYRAAVAEFRSWAQANGFPTSSPVNVDRALVAFFTEAGYGSGMGRHALFGWFLLEHIMEGESGRSLLPSARKALQGWSKAAPGVSGNPVPFICLWRLAMWAVEQGYPRHAALMVLQADVYGRPRETLQLETSDVGMPAPHAGEAFRGKWVISFRFSKSGENDETVVAGINGRGWASSILAKLHSTAAGSGRFFDFSYEGYLGVFNRGVLDFGHDEMKLSPHSLRRTSPSGDRFEHNFPFRDIQKRGRWSSFKSVARCEKHAQLLRQLGLLSRQQQEHARVALPQLRQALTASL